MATRATKHIERYYDSHLRDDEELSETIFHDIAIEYIRNLLRVLYPKNGANGFYGIISDVNLYITANKNEEPLSPDVSVIPGLQDHNRSASEAGSYYIGEDGPPPTVVFEMSSKSTWPNDIKLPEELESNEEITVENKVQKVKPKIPRYAALGIKEYFAFDPNRPSVWTKKWKEQNRLMGWRLTEENQYERISKNEAGWLWSEQLNCFLVVDEQYLKLYDVNCQEILAADAQLEIQKQQVAEANYKAKLEQQRANEAAHKARLEQERADAAEREKQVLLDKLRALGIDPAAL